MLLFSPIILGQTAAEKIIHGKIIIESHPISGVTIINLVNEKSTVSDSNGEFYILAKADDLLVFTSVNLEYHRKQIEEEDLKQDIITIKMTAKITELDEVIINKHPEINAVALGISPAGIKKYTPAERRLKTAGEFKPIQLLGLLGGSMPLDPLINSISGRTAMLKKELEVEKKELLLVQIDALYDNEYFVQKLKIPEDYINGFKHYIIENEKFTTVLKSKNKKMGGFLMIDLAREYNQIILNEK